MTDSVTVREVGLRDGLQLVKNTVHTSAKSEWIRMQAATGLLKWK